MERERNIHTDTYSHGDFLIDIVYGKDNFQAYISHKDNAIKYLMFGADQKVDYDRFVDTVRANLETYIDIYTQEYMEE